MGDVEAAMALQKLSEYLFRHHGKRALILLDEYDTPLQEAYVGGYWNIRIIGLFYLRKAYGNHWVGSL